MVAGKISILEIRSPHGTGSRLLVASDQSIGFGIFGSEVGDAENAGLLSLHE